MGIAVGQAAPTVEAPVESQLRGQARGVGLREWIRGSKEPERSSKYLEFPKNLTAIHVINS